MKNENDRCTRFINKLVFAAALAVPAWFAAPAHAQEPAIAAAPALSDVHKSFRETGRFGLIGALTEDMWKGGVVFEHEHFEAQVLAHAGFEADHTRDVHIIMKAGARFALGTLNYLAIGGEFGPHPGSKDHGVSIGGSFQLGPYVSLQRYFAATPVMLCLWVNPVQYDHSIVPNAAGTGGTAKNAVRVVQTGGFGIAYLF